MKSGDLLGAIMGLAVRQIEARLLPFIENDPGVFSGKF